MFVCRMCHRQSLSSPGMRLSPGLCCVVSESRQVGQLVVPTLLRASRISFSRSCVSYGSCSVPTVPHAADISVCLFALVVFVRAERLQARLVDEPAQGNALHSQGEEVQAGMCAFFLFVQCVDRADRLTNEQTQYLRAASSGKRLNVDMCVCCG